MIAGIIGWSARNSVLVLIGTLFAIVAGIYSIARIPLDAIPDLSDTQVIIVTDYPGQAPQVVEDQVTFPLATAMLNVPRARVVRGFSFFGVSFVYVVFEDGADLYWARSRVLEYLSAAAERLPDGVTPSLGPDATGVGWVYQYALKSSELNLAELRSLQDWQVRFAVSRAEGVAEVATVGGFVRQYAVIVDPLLLKSTGLTLSDIAGAVRTSNMDVGGRTIELAETEFMIRGRGYLAGIEDIEKIVLRAEGGTPLLLRDVARVELAPDERRGVAEMGGEGEAVSGIALQRHGANALDVIENVKRELAAVAPSLPGNTEIVEVYDRSALIGRAINTLVRTLVEESVVVALVCFMFLWHARSALVAIVTLPVGILMALAATHVLSIPSNIMSLGGIAIAIGAMVDAAIVMIENAHKRLEHAPPGASRTAVVIEAAQEVGPALFFSLLIITVSFLPIFTLEAQEGRLFKPLAATKTFAMAAAALLSITLVPVLMTIFIRGRIVPEDQNPLNKALIWLYRPVIGLVLRARGVTILAAFIVLAVTAVPLSRIGSEFMPNLNEGTLLYMPTTLPGLSVTKAAELLQTQNRIIAGFPEVASVWGKAGRADSATDPAPMEMFETIINLKPESDWRQGMNLDKLIAEMDTALQFTGRLQCLDDAHQGPHRHALDRHPHDRSASRYSGPTSSNWSGSPARSKPSCVPFPALRRPMPSASMAAISSTSVPTATASPGTGCRWRRCRKRSRWRWARKPSPPRSKAASATMWCCAIRKPPAPTRMRSRARSLSRRPQAPLFRSARSPTSRGRVAPPWCAPKAASRSSMSLSISATAISAAMSARHGAWSPAKSRCRPATRSPGAASSNIWRARSNAFPSSFQLRCWSFSCSSISTLRASPKPSS